MVFEILLKHIRQHIPYRDIGFEPDSKIPQSAEYSLHRTNILIVPAEIQLVVNTIDSSDMS